jgi:hypothetical protein
MDKKKNPSNFFIYVAITIITLAIAVLYFAKNYSTDELIANFKNKTKDSRNLPESIAHQNLQQINELKNQLELCNLERERLQHDSTKVALVMADSYRLLINELFALNHSFQRQQNYEHIINQIRLLLKQQASLEPFQNYFAVLENYNSKYLQNPSSAKTVALGSGWLRNFLDKWITIEKLDEEHQAKATEYEKTFKAIEELSNYVSSEDFLKKFIGS